MVTTYGMGASGLRPEVMLARNIQALLRARGHDMAGLAAFCRHGTPWISKILAGDRNVQVNDLGKIADFFGLTVPDLFQYGIDPLLERRRTARRVSERRSGEDRRTKTQKRDSAWVHPEDEAAYRKRHSLPQRK